MKPIINDIEKYSSAYTLSDMEIFVFPDLLYSLVLANIMSPEIWKWKDDKWFSKMENKSFIYRINRVKQYIIEHYIFNLDLETWGLTTKESEIERFKNFVSPEVLAQSNALFGYEGDKYYFSIDIRKHFGLDKYTSNLTPYWKTETIEAMNAFKFKEGFETGAGECVSLSALYAAALFIVAKIPLEKIFLMATPLHSQNFITEDEGFLTNNRRIVTKNMWYNESEISTKARRALENEEVSIVSHISGYIHSQFQKATINFDDYREFSEKLQKFLKNNNEEKQYLNIEAKLPSENKEQFETKALHINADMTREDIENEIMLKAEENETAKLAIYASRKMNNVDWQPFMKAAFERNPVCIEALKDLKILEVYEILQKIPENSIYEDENRLALPDEVWNFKRGDGLEKCLLFINILKDRKIEINNISLLNNTISIITDDNDFYFQSEKKILLKKFKENYANYYNF